MAALAPHVVTLSMHKFASNVVEKCLTHCSYAERDAIIKTILASDAPGGGGVGGGAPATPPGSGGFGHHHSNGGGGSGALGGVGVGGLAERLQASLGFGGGGGGGVGTASPSGGLSRHASVTGAAPGGGGDGLGEGEDGYGAGGGGGGAVQEDALTVMMKDQFGNYVVQRVSGSRALPPRTARA